MERQIERLVAVGGGDGVVALQFQRAPHHFPQARVVIRD
jgi:hypothetical protein